MASLTVNYVAYARRGRRRSASSAQQLIAPTLSSTLVDGSSANLTAFDISGFPTFAFWSVTGEPNGGRTSNNRDITVSAGSSPLVATAWYIPLGGGGTGGPGIGIDAFDVDAGDFFDDDFVTVPSNPALAAAANEDGWVPTNSAATIQAFDPCSIAVRGASVPFQLWNVVVPPASPSGTTLNVPVNSNATAFAFYKAKKAPKLNLEINEALVWLLLLGGIEVGGGGIQIGPGGGGPVGPVGPLLSRLRPAARAGIQAIALAEVARALPDRTASAALRKSALAQLQQAVRGLSDG